MSSVRALNNSPYYWSKVDLITQKNILVIDVEQYGGNSSSSSSSQIRKRRIIDIDKDKPFKCGLCFYSSRKRNNLKAHTRTHSGVRPYKCDKCNFVSTHKSFLCKHKESHATEQEIILLDDDRRAADTLVQSNCFKEHTACPDVKPFKCGMCLYSTRKKKNLVAHMRTHSDVKPYKCDQCGFCTTHKSILKHHRAGKCRSGDKTSAAKSNQSLRLSCSEDLIENTPCIIVPDVEGEPTLQTNDASISRGRVVCEKSETNVMCSENTLFICNVCEYSSYDKDKLESHKRKRHDLDKLFKCEQCDYAAKSKKNLASHKSSQHMAKRLKCSQCDYKSNRRSDFTMHLLKHSLSTPYQCHLCQFATKAEQYLKAHVRNMHSSDKPYKCKSCNHSTFSRTWLIRHNRIHTGERPYKCDTCYYATQHKPSLIVHKRSHTGEKPFKCPHCEEYATPDPSHIVKHVRKIHGKRVIVRGLKVIKIP